MILTPIIAKKVSKSRNNELMSTILSFCPDVDIVEPLELRQKFYGIIKNYL